MHIRMRDGLLVHYRTYGSGPTVALLHPVGMNGAFWSQLTEGLSDRYRFVAIDFRGHGLSEVPRTPFTLEDLADDVGEVLAHCTSKPAAVIGLSLGGMIAQLVALRHSQRVAALVLANTRSQAGSAQSKAFEERARRAEQDGMIGMLDQTLERWFTPDFRRYQPALVAEFRRTLLEADPTVHAWTWRAMTQLGNHGALGHISTPTLVLHGAEDAGSPIEEARTMAAAIPGATFLALSDAGHMSLTEQPVPFSAAVDRFLLGVFPD